MGTFADLAFRNFVARYGEKALDAVVTRLEKSAEEWHQAGAAGQPPPSGHSVRVEAWFILRDVLINFYDPSVVDQAIEKYRPK